MKTLITLTALTVMALAWVRPVWGQTEGHYDLVSASEVIRGEQYTITLSAWERQKLEITVHKPLNVGADIAVRTAERDLISEQHIDRSIAQFRRIVNVRELAPGRYWLDIRIGKTTHRRELRIASAEATFRSLTMQE